MVSVIIPCYNCGNTISRAIISVLRQTYTDIEILLINNNSEDNTIELLNYYQGMFPEKIFVYEEKKKGAPAARNLGLKKAKGEWIQFLDADDELLSHKIDHQLQVADVQKADVIAGESLLKYTSDKKTVNVARHADEDPWRGLITSNLGITSSNLWRRSMLEKVGGWDEQLSSSQEYDLLLRLLQNDAVIAADKAMLTIIHFSDSSISKSPDIERKKVVLDNRINLRLRIKETLTQKNELTPALEKTIDTYIYTEILHYYKFFPEHARELLNIHKLNVSIQKKVRLRARLLVNKFRN